MLSWGRAGSQFFEHMDGAVPSYGEDRAIMQSLQELRHFVQVSGRGVSQENNRAEATHLDHSSRWSKHALKGPAMSPDHEQGNGEHKSLAKTRVWPMKTQRSRATELGMAV